MIINYKKIRSLTKTKRLPNGIIKYSFVPEYYFRYNLNPPIPIITVEGSKHKYMKEVLWFIRNSPRVQKYLTLPDKYQFWNQF